MQYFTSEVISLNSRIKDLEEQLNKAKESNEILTRERDEARKAVEEISKYTILFLENTTENVYGEWNVDSFKKRINDLCKSYNYNKLIEITKINVNNNRTKLHRWCNSTSEYYKNKCDWEKKFINANKDNCFSN